MKILVVSLLRLGDLILQRPLLQALKNKYPQAELHLLINSQFSHAKSILTEVDHLHFFERDRLQQMLGEAETPIFRPCHELDKMVKNLNAHQFSQVYNFTHNRLSGHLMSLIQCSQKYGLQAEHGRFQAFNSPWMRFFNDRFGDHAYVNFHYSEALAYAFGLVAQAPRLQHREHGTIYIQALTSDPKKNWGLAYFRQLVDQLTAFDENQKIKILSSDFEKNELNKYFSDEEILVAGLDELPLIFQQAKLLISLDTSIKHLAAQVGVPILEIAIGSSDPQRTATFAHGAWVLHSAIGCAPCVHSSPCRKLSHQCAEELPVALVAKMTQAILQNQLSELGKLSVNNKSIQIMQTSVHSSLGWTIDKISRPELRLCSLVDKRVWAMTLNATSDKNEFPPVATEAMQIADATFANLDAETLLRVLGLLQEEQKSLKIIANGVEKVLEESAQLCIATNFDMGALQALRQSLSRVHGMNPRIDLLLRPLTELSAMSYSTPFHFFGAVRKRLADLQMLLTNRNKLIQCLIELGGKSEKGRGKLSERSLEAP